MEENIGAGVALILTLAPPSVVPNLPSGPKLVAETLVPSFKLFPKMAAIAPGATEAGCSAKLAALTTPPSNTAGAGGSGPPSFIKNASFCPTRVCPGKVPEVPPVA